MPPLSGLSATAARIPIDIRRFPWIRPLAADYAFHYGKLAEFFAGDPQSRDAWSDAIARAQRHPRSADVASVVESQQRRRGAPSEAVAAAARLREPGAVAIVTGQQAGLFGGPLFTLLKALTALRLAEQVQREHQVPAVAVFWIDAEDHDWDEVSGCGVLDTNANLQRVSVGTPPGAREYPVARVCLDAAAESAVAMLESTFPPTEFTPALLDTLRRIYRPGAGMADAFGQWLESVLGPKGLVVFDASDPAAKPAAAPLFAREVARAGETALLASEAGARLEARGYHRQVTPAEGSVALFHINGGRHPIRRQDGQLHVGDQTMTVDAIRARVLQSPEEFSPNVLLRPLVQDTLFPTVCYVAGPNELAYLGQLRGIYDAFGVPMPLMYHRASVTILDANAMRFLSRHELPFEALQAQDDAVLNHLLAAHLPPSVDAAMEAAARTLDEHMARLAAEVPLIDPTLEAAARSTLGRMQDDLKKLQHKIIQAAKRKDETLRRQFGHARAQSFPGGEPQERAVGFVGFLNRYGPGLIDRLTDEVPLDMGSHQLVTI